MEISPNRQEKAEKLRSQKRRRAARRLLKQKQKELEERAALELSPVEVDIVQFQKDLPREGIRKKQRERLKKARKWLLNYAGSNVYDDYRKQFHTDSVFTFRDFQLLGISFPENLKDEVNAESEARKQQKEDNRLKRIKNRQLKKVMKPQFDVGDVYDEVYGYLKQSNISQNNIQRLRKFAASDIPEVACYGKLVLEVAEFKTHKKRRLKELAKKRPDLLQQLEETLLIMAHGY